MLLAAYSVLISQERVGAHDRAILAAQPRRQPLQTGTGETRVPTYKILLHCSASKRPSLQILEADDDLAAELVAEDLLVAGGDTIGVEVWREGWRVYVRGVIPLREPD